MTQTEYVTIVFTPGVRGCDSMLMGLVQRETFGDHAQVICSPFKAQTGTTLEAREPDVGRRADTR